MLQQQVLGAIPFHTAEHRIDGEAELLSGIGPASLFIRPAACRQMNRCRGTGGRRYPLHSHCLQRCGAEPWR